MHWWWCHGRGAGAGRVLNVAAALLLAVGLPAPAAAPRPRPCRDNALCLCRDDHFSCNYVPFHRFPDTEAGVWHVSVSAARLGALGEAALDARRLRTLVLVASRLHHIHHNALASMVSTLASLDLGYNEFTEVPIEALRELKVLNWLNLQNNFINDIVTDMDWGFLSDSLSSLYLSNNHLCTLSEGAFSSLRQLAQLDLDGNRLHAVAATALPSTLALLRLSDNMLTHMRCATLALLPRLRHLHLRNNMLQPSQNRTCLREHYKIDSLDLSHNELDDHYVLEFQHSLQLKQLILDLNDFTSVPKFVHEIGRLEKLSISHNRLSYLSEVTIHAVKHNLERLDLDHNELMSLPASIRDLGRLRHLSLAYNRLERLSDLPPNLNSLSLAGNYLTSFPEGLNGLTAATLGYLDIGYNQISTISTEVFGAWSEALVTLNVRGNRLVQLVAGVFPVALPVRELLLSFNDLYHVDPDAFANLTMLQMLELSSTSFSGEFPIGSYFDKLSWLSLDNNNIHYISSDDIQNFPLLEYLNLDFNKIIEFPSEVIKTNRSYRLKELRLSYNYISKINSESLIDLAELQSLDLSYNRVQNISERSFGNLLNLVYLSLAGNMVEFVAERAFHHLPRLEVLDLQENNLVEFSTEYFHDVSNEDTNFSLNVSFNRISSLIGGPVVFVNIIDLSYNLLDSLSKIFFDSLGPHIRQIILSHNKLVHIESSAFGALPKLEILSLNNNNVTSVKKKTFAEMPSLQILDLSRNRLTQLSVEQFHNMRHLRHLRLDSNDLRSIPRDCFKNTILEHLDLSDNQLIIFPSSALAQVGFTLRKLDLAGNGVEYLDTAMFHAIAFLYELNLARNALTVLSDNTFAGLGQLRRLDLSYNMIKTNFKELFHNLPQLRSLSLAGIGLKTVPHLPLTNLTELNLSRNYITSYQELDVHRLTNLRVLDLARNKFTSLQPAMWAVLPRLTSLDVSHNPLVRITRGTFEGLDRLLRLRCDHLRNIEAIEPRAFRSLVSLRSMTLDSPTVVGRTEVTLAEIATSTPGLESLTVIIREATLDSQLHGLQAAKLRLLQVKGMKVKHLSADAFSALGRQRSLMLRLTETSVSVVPAGLVLPLAHVPHLALDLSDNRLLTFGPATLYPNLTGWNRLATKLLSGGLVLTGNPLRCGCSVSWVGSWLRRWSAEVGGGSRGALEAARRGTCGAEGVRRVPLLQLEPDEAECHASALSSRAAPPAPAPRALTLTLPLLWIILLHALS